MPMSDSHRSRALITIAALAMLAGCLRSGVAPGQHRQGSDGNQSARTVTIAHGHGSGPRNGLNSVQAPLGPVLDLAGKLTARGIDILASRFATGGDQTRVLQDSLKGDDPVARAGPELGVRKRIEGDQ